MTNEQAKSELMQIYGSLSEEKKQALDVLMAQADVTDDDIATMRILFNADIECLCNQGRFNDAKEMEQIRDRLKARLQADGEYKSNKELLCDSCYRKIAGCQAKFHNPHPVDHCIEYKPIEKQADGEYINGKARNSMDRLISEQAIEKTLKQNTVLGKFIEKQVEKNIKMREYWTNVFSNELIDRMSVIRAINDAYDETDDKESYRDKVTHKMMAIPSAEPKTGYISIDDVMSVFDDFMCGEVDEDGTDTFLEMLKDKAESEDKE